MGFKRLIPGVIKRYIKLFMRSCVDHCTGDKKLFARPAEKPVCYPYSINITQKINQSECYREKIHNLERALEKINYTPIHPGEIFSFWHCVGAPEKKNGYVKGRSLVSGMLQQEYGGGLCQLSGLLYYLALKSGQAILERHSHSLDIYAEHERFTPLGADATVVYGYKDLRFENILNGSMYFIFNLKNSEITGSLFSEKAISPHELEFDRCSEKNVERVITYRVLNDSKMEITRSLYKKMHR